VVAINGASWRKGGKLHGANKIFSGTLACLSMGLVCDGQEK